MGYLTLQIKKIINNFEFIYNNVLLAFHKICTELDGKLFPFKNLSSWKNLKNK